MVTNRKKSIVTLLTIFTVCLPGITVYGNTINGALESTDCLSILYDTAYYADVYTFTLSSPASFSAEMQTSDLNGCLYLYLGREPNQSRKIAEACDFNFPPSAALLEKNLFAGTYCLEASTSFRKETGDYTLVSSVDLTQLPPCSTFFDTGSSQEPDALSIGFNDAHYSDVYTFTLASADKLVIDVESEDFNECLYLYAGSQPYGSPKIADFCYYFDDSPYVANIGKNLNAGNYCIEVTTYDHKATGSYDLVSSVALTKRDRSSYSRTGTIESTDCLSVQYNTDYYHYTDIYTFTLASADKFVIDVESADFNGCLYLYSGSQPQGSPKIAEFCDYSNDYPYVANIGKELGPGNYCFEVTTYDGEDTGAYDLISSVVLTPQPCDNCDNDSILDPGEDCDGVNLNGETCISQGFKGGTLACSENCTFDTTACIAIIPITCGNGAIDTGEECDGANLGGATCESLNLPQGGLTCTDVCTFDISGCGTLCGNGIIDVGEQCDGTDLGGKTCTSLGFDGGVLDCSLNCSLDTIDCYGSSSTTSPSTTTTTAELTTTTSKTCLCPLLCIFGEGSEEVELLRYFRDSGMSKTPEGEALIKLYYQWSPVIVKIMDEDHAFKEWVKEAIEDVLPLIK